MLKGGQKSTHQTRVHLIPSRQSSLLFAFKRRLWGDEAVWGKASHRFTRRQFSVLNGFAVGILAPPSSVLMITLTEQAKRRFLHRNLVPGHPGRDGDLEGPGTPT